MISRKKVDPTFKTMSDCKQVDLQPGCIELFSIKTDEFISLSKTEEAKIDLKKKGRGVYFQEIWTALSPLKDQTLDLTTNNWATIILPSNTSLGYLSLS
jgi:hypothetical protein